MGSLVLMMDTSAVARAWSAVTKMTAARLGFELRVVVRRAEHTGEELLLVRIQRTGRKAAGWPEAAPALRLASAGATGSMGSALR